MEASTDLFVRGHCLEGAYSDCISELAVLFQQRGPRFPGTHHSFFDRFDGKWNQKLGLSYVRSSTSTTSVNHLLECSSNSF